MRFPSFMILTCGAALLFEAGLQADDLPAGSSQGSGKGRPQFLTDGYTDRGLGGSASQSTACSFDPPVSSSLGHLTGGAGFYFLKPYFDNNQAYTVKSTLASMAPGMDATAVSSVQRDFCLDPAFAPLIWVGYATESGLGIRARWWHLEQGSQLAAVNADPAGETTITSAAPRGLSITSPGHLLKAFGAGADAMVFDSNLRLDSWDLEATQDWQAGCWSLLVSGGIRYVHLAQNYNAYRFNSGTAGAVVFAEDFAALQSGHNLSAFGPTLSLELRRPLGKSGFSFYADGRGALLFGCQTQQANRLAVQAGTNAMGPFETSNFTNSDGSRDALLPILELEVGAEYGRDYGAWRPFLRTGLVGQTWFGAGNPAGPGSNLGFYGLTVSAGVQF